MFLRPILDIVVPTEGHTGRFECQVHPGSNDSDLSSSTTNLVEPSLDICWFKDEELLVIDASNRYRLDSARSGFYALLIDDIGEDDVGTYYCVATNSNGQRIFSAANLTIDSSGGAGSKGGAISRMDDDVKSIADSFATCEDNKSCISTSTDMQSCITGATGHQSGRRRGSSQSVQSAFSDTTSIISDLDFGDSNSGAGGPLGGMFGEMPTYQMCEFIQKPKGGVFNEGSTVELIALVSGYPLPVVEWFRNGKLFKSAGRVTIMEDPTAGMCTLKIKECDLTDAGEYTVAANNTVNAIYTIVNVSIQEVEEEEEEEADEEEEGDEEPEEEEAITEEDEEEDEEEDGEEDAEEGEGTETEGGTFENQSKTALPSVIPQTAIKLPGRPTEAPQKFFGPNFPAGSRKSLEVPKIELSKDSDNHSNLGSSFLAEEIFETLKMKKTACSSNDSNSYPSTISTGVSPSKNITASSSSIALSVKTPVLISSPVLPETDNVFDDAPTFDPKNPSNSSGFKNFQAQSKTLGLPNSSPPTASKSTSPRCRPSLNDLPKYPPEIVQPLNDITVISNTPVSLECTFSLPVPETVVWFRNNEAIQMSHSITSTLDSQTGKATLSINSVLPLDEGIYEVLGKNILGEIQSSAVLKVEAAQLRRISESDEDTMCESVKTDDGNSSNTVLGGGSSCSTSRRVSLTGHLASVDESSSAAVTPGDHENFSSKEFGALDSVRTPNTWQVITSYYDEDNGLSLNKGESVLLIDDETDKWVVRHSKTLALGCVPAYILKSFEDLTSEGSPNVLTSPTFQQGIAKRSKDSADSSIPDVQLSDEVGATGVYGEEGSSGGVEDFDWSQAVRKRRNNQTDSASSETDDRTSGEFYELYRAIANYQPASGLTSGVASSASHQSSSSSGGHQSRGGNIDCSTDDSIWLSEGQFVEVLDNSNANKWMVRTKASKTSPVRIGWVPSSFLEKLLDTLELKRPGSWNFDSESSEAAQFTLKKQHSHIGRATSSGQLMVKRATASSSSNLTPAPDETAENKLKSAILELFCTEETYVSDLKFVIQNCIPAINSYFAPVQLREKGAKEKLFVNIENIYRFNYNNFLPELKKYKEAQPEEVGNCFLTWQESFEMYVEYCQHKETAQRFLSTPAIKTFFDEFLRKMNVKMDMGTYLIKPVQRITKYHLILKEILKYSSKLKRDTSAVEKALSVMIEVPAKANNLMQIDSIVDCPFGLEKVGALIMIDDVTVWESKPRTQGKERTLFLFRHMILFTKKKQEKSQSSPVYCYKKHMQVAGVGINFKDTDDKRRFELYMGRREVTTNFSIIQAKSFYKKEAWVKEILTLQAKDNEEIQEMRTKAKRRTRLSEPIPAHIASGFDSLYRKLDESKTKKQNLVDFACIGSVFGVVHPCGPGFKPGDNVEVIKPPSPRCSNASLSVASAEPQGTLRKNSVASLDIWVKALTGSRAGEVACLPRDALTKHEQIADESVITQFEKVLKDQEILEGHSVELDVKVNKEVTSVSWLKDEDELTRTTSVNDLTKREEGRLCFHSNFRTGEHKLSISECLLGDSGHYKCKAESDHFASSCSANLTVLRNQKVSTGSDASLSQRLSNTLKRHKKSRTSELSSVKTKMSRAASTNLSEISPRQPKLIVSPSEDDNNSPSPAPSSTDIQNPTFEQPDQLLASHGSNLNIASSGTRKLSAFLESSLSRFKAHRHVSDDNLSHSLNLSLSSKMMASSGMTSLSPSGASPHSRTMPRRADTINLGSEYVRKPRKKMGSIDLFK